ncbi:tungstate ABC transporter substrate-binding protein WtpA [Candidatus Aciduliprofundum boonei]|uniref:Extracellular solute-binding protein family 1 n=1 Tax=Aciduliprofundum boonei (strain DSM 19572 / T469) TaxID=439481 RepID=B5ID22_ACIB4|nr:tungstate ABC transporter substrate-binding protein WtpA [Candidatus Aciduliprofundum boonei]ADD09212.1 extracellular solute-binding protein family 1 [Aciduliprofundum boonei T469]EDY35798.1 Bacterial extracellular solute-binding protein, putative [Aciduliprofundum boonei T469]HII55824.1 tungstate ABC transporter substrate-binding protein WtpA [Candidatus Aciduliprofundum boonei]
MPKKVVIAILIVLLILLAGGYYYINYQNTSEGSIKVLAAGSLSVPLKELANKFQEKYGVKVYIETAGSIDTVKKVSELGIKADVVAVADYNAISSYLMPNYTNWYIKFARNELVIAYTNNSRFAKEINSTNWMNILTRKDVRIGFSSPNDDPCGYRAVIMFYLAQLKYKNGIFDNLILNHTGIKIDNGTIIVPNDSELLTTTGKIFIKQKSVDLLADLQAGDIDYAIEYLSVAKQHHINYIRLPDVINLSNSTLVSWYSKAVVKLADGKIIHGDAINYAVTIPNNAPNKEYAYKFVNMLLGKEGRSILKNCGQEPIFEPVGNVPKEVKP